MNTAVRCRNDSSLNDRNQIDPSYEIKTIKEYGTNIEDEEIHSEVEATLLVIYTGGTIGMMCRDGVYSPASNYLVQELRKLPMFHDPEYTFKATPGDGSTESEGIPLVMPISKQGKHIIYTVYEYEPLLDSANMTMDDWIRIARDIKRTYHRYDGFVILHGTDTMAYTASALSFMLEDLGKPVILTGSQIPIFETRCDGRDNFLGALILAGHYCIPEVTIYFHNKLMRGNRCTKVDNSSLDAFDCPNMSPLVNMEVGININWQSVMKPSSIKKFDISNNLCPNVGLLRLFPSITAATVQAFLNPPIEGVVLQSYGAGNGPSARVDLLNVFKEATMNNGVIIVNTTQCARGFVSSAYETGKALLDVGIIPGSDMTPEATLTKLSYVLGKDISLDEKRKLMETNLRGEMKKMFADSSEVSLSDISLIDKLSKALNLSTSEEITTLRNAMIPSLMSAAAKTGDIETMEKLLLSDGSVRMNDYDGRTPLHIAACEGHVDAVQFLLKKGALVHARDRFQNTALNDAIRFGHPDVVHLLFECGAHLNYSPGRLGQELCWAASEDNVTILKCYDVIGANLSQADFDGRTALHVACARGFQSVVEFLLKKEVTIDVEDNFGTTPISEATRIGNRKIAEILSGYYDGGEILSAETDSTDKIFNGD
ncbi:L-asparaginase-like [Tubulanus polymorphus]|uniref:L-asparaginase-like n=1 Tax=Tubulanus polymorphus TaxID=672921 RepID=UPI003DA23791